MEALLAEHREHEKNLQSTLIMAQKLSEEIKEQARAEATRVVHEAESRSSLLFDQAQQRFDDIQREIDGLKLKRRQAETTLESTIQTLQNTLEFVREHDEREGDEKILLHRPRQIAESLPGEHQRAVNR